MNIIQLKKFHQQLQLATHIDAVNACLRFILTSYGITRFAMTCYYKKGQQDNTVVEYAYMSSAYQVWHDHYHEERYDEIDTTSHTTKATNLPVFWDIHQQIAAAKTPREKQMRLDSLAFGADRGITIPVNSANGEIAMLMLAQCQGEHCLDDWHTLQYDFFMIAHYYTHYLRELLIKENTAGHQRYQLNQRQMQCLVLISAGNSVEDIAIKLQIKSRTVNYHIQKMNKNLGTKNKYMSVAKAQREGII